MSQKSNTLTLRNNVINNSFQLSVNSKSFISLYKLFEFINRLFFLKGVSVFNYNIGINSNLVFFNFFIFYNSFRLSFFKKLKKKQKNRFKKLQFNLRKINLISFSFILKQFFKFFRLNKSILRFHVLNYKNDPRILVFLYSKLKIFVSTIFSRRFNLFIDFLKITSLFIMDRGVDANIYSKFLGRILKFLSKRQHGKFIFFVKKLFEIITTSLKKRIDIKSKLLNKEIIGVKFLLSGRFRAKDRSKSKLLRMGRYPVQSFSSMIDYSFAHVFTLYGVFGLKLWLCRNR